MAPATERERERRHQQRALGPRQRLPRRLRVPRDGRLGGDVVGIGQRAAREQRGVAIGVIGVPVAARGADRREDVLEIDAQLPRIGT